MIKSVKPIMIEEDHGLLTPGCVVEIQDNVSEKSKKLYLAWYDDFTIGNPGTHLLGIYDSKEAAEKRITDYKNRWIKNDSQGPLGEVWICETTLNEDWPGNPEEAWIMNEKRTT